MVLLGCNKACRDEVETATLISSCYGFKKITCRVAESIDGIKKLQKPENLLHFPEPYHQSMKHSEKM